jgi:hypothetical protein
MDKIIIYGCWGVALGLALGASIFSDDVCFNMFMDTMLIVNTMFLTGVYKR